MVSPINNWKGRLFAIFINSQPQVVSVEDFVFVYKRNFSFHSHIFTEGFPSAIVIPQGAIC